MVVVVVVRHTRHLRTGIERTEGVQYYHQQQQQHHNVFFLFFARFFAVPSSQQSVSIQCCGGDRYWFGSASAVCVCVPSCCCKLAAKRARRGGGSCSIFDRSSLLAHYLSSLLLCTIWKRTDVIDGSMGDWRIDCSGSKYAAISIARRPIPASLFQAIGILDFFFCAER